MLHSWTAGRADAGAAEGTLDQLRAHLVPEVAPDCLHQGNLLRALHQLPSVQGFQEGNVPVMRGAGFVTLDLHSPVNEPAGPVSSKCVARLLCTKTLYATAIRQQVVYFTGGFFERAMCMQTESTPRETLDKFDQIHAQFNRSGGLCCGPDMSAHLCLSC